MRSDRRVRPGFTLIELLLVVVIIGILASIVVTNLVGRRKDADEKAAKGSLTAFRTALDAYAVDTGRYPSTDQGLEALLLCPSGGAEAKHWKGPYLQLVDIPADPWGHPYRYVNPGAARPPLYDLYSAGEDGVEGTPDDIRAF